MTHIRSFQYQIKTEPTRLPPLDNNAASRLQPWSEPVRFRHIHTSRIVSGCTWNPQQPLPPTSIWYRPLSEPVRLKIGLRPWHQQYEAIDTIPAPEPEHFSDAWIKPFTLPVWPQKGLRAYYHYPYFAPPRLLPTPQVLMTYSGVEVNEDVFQGGLYVFDPEPSPASREGASVVIIEVPANNNAGLSIREP